MSRKTVRGEGGWPYHNSADKMSCCCHELLSAFNLVATATDEGATDHIAEEALGFSFMARGSGSPA